MQPRLAWIARCVLSTRHTNSVIMSIQLIYEKLNQTKTAFMRRANPWAQKAREQGNRPFGSVVVSGAGTVLKAAFCNTIKSGDCTGHAETKAVRQLSPKVCCEVLASSTLYLLAAPCVMCAGAIF